MIVSHPQTLDELIDLLEERKSQAFFRGQSPESRVLNSTLARELRGESSRLPRNYIPKEPLPTWTVKQMHKYHGIILNTFIPDGDVLRPLNGRGDPTFEILRYIQQNPLQPKMRNAIPHHPTPTIEFSESSLIALFFASYKPDKDGAVFCLSKSAIHTLFSFQEALQSMLHKNDARPCIVDPLAKLNDLDDPKPKRQEATYIFQRDLRYSLDHYLPIEKMVVSQTMHPAIITFLKDQGITEDFVYNRTARVSSNQSLSL